MNLEEFEADLNAASAIRALEDNDFQLTAFSEEAFSRLVAAEELLDIDAVQYSGSGRNGKKLQADGYSWEPSTGLLSLLVADFAAPSEEGSETLSLTEARKLLTAGKAFFIDSAAGYLSEVVEESSSAAGLAGLIRDLGNEIEKVQVYLVTNRRMSDRIKSIESEADGGFYFTFQIWDTQRFYLTHISGTGREALEIDFSRWIGHGLPVLQGTTTSEGATSYLALIPAEALAQVYEEFGSRLLEANVRSFLSTRGKVNAGIRQTLRQSKEMFLAYNNGITTTAQSVQTADVDGQLRLLKVNDWQIVNGGQTTASIANFRRSEKGADLSDVFVQMKLVVIDSEKAEEVVQSIARFANSQNPVNEADFFANSPFHRQIEEFSSRLLAPSKEGQQYQTRWFYERARGQYVNEKSKRAGAELRKFEMSNPRNQVITKTDLAKYLHSWNELPHLVSQGAQANFLKFAKETSAKWESDRSSINEQYFKEIVAIALLFNLLRASVMSQSWYENGYLANIVAYSLSKFHKELRRNFRDREFDLLSIWKKQEVESGLLDELLRIAKLVLEKLTDPSRPVANVTQWAKQESCWDAIRDCNYEFATDLSLFLVDQSDQKEVRKEARKAQNLDSGIEAQSLVVKQPIKHWEKILNDPALATSMSPTDIDLAQIMTKPRAVPSEKQALRLIKVLESAVQNGTIPQSALDR